MTSCKEYLMPNRNYEYILTDSREGLEPHAKDWIEIPEGAIRARFYPHDPDGLEFENAFFQWWHDENNEWISYGSYSNTLEHSRVVWQRDQDEPFLTPECTLNDQYAEIEQVRQGGLKFDNGKPRHSLLPKGSISSIIAVLEFGAKKYEANNWQKVDNAKERYYDAAMRHIDSWWSGEKFDQETGIHHLAHAATNLFFLKWFDDKDNNNG